MMERDWARKQSCGSGVVAAEETPLLLPVHTRKVQEIPYVILVSGTTVMVHEIVFDHYIRDRLVKGL